MAKDAASRKIVLAIETSNPSSCEPGAAWSPGVGVGRQDGVVLGVRAIPPRAAHDDALMPAIDGLMRELGLRPRDIGTVAVAVGPGGFTAVRVAVTTAKMIAEATGAACVPVPTALVAAACRGPGEFGVALASKDTSVHLTMFSGEAMSVGRIVDEGTLGEAMGSARELIADRHLPAGIRARAAALGIEVRPPMLGPEGVLRAWERCAAVEPAALLPLYPREPEAVTKWRALHAGRRAGGG